MQIVQNPKFSEYDYRVKKVDRLEYLVSVLTSKLQGKYKILLDMDLKELSDAIEHVNLNAYDVDIYLKSKNEINIFRDKYPNLFVDESENPYNYFCRQITDSNLVFNKDAFFALYRATRGRKELLKTTLELLRENHGNHDITIEDVSSYVIVPPRITVRKCILAFLKMTRYRWSYYREITKYINGKALWIYVEKLLDSLIADQTECLKGGPVNEELESVPMANIISLYFLMLEYRKSKDMALVLKIYERRTTE